MGLKLSKFAFSEVAKSNSHEHFLPEGFMYSHFCLLRKLNRNFFHFDYSDFNSFWYENYADLITAFFVAYYYIASFAIHMCTKCLLTCCNDLNQ